MGFWGFFHIDSNFTQTDVKKTKQTVIRYNKYVHLTKNKTGVN